MQRVLVDESSFTSKDEVHAYLADQLDFPGYYGANLDALSDCLGDVCDECEIAISLADYPLLAVEDEEAEEGPQDASEDPEDAQDAFGELYDWFPRLCRTILRSAHGNPSLKASVHVGSLQGFERLAACPGLPELLSGEGYVVKGKVTSSGAELDLVEG